MSILNKKIHGSDREPPLLRSRLKKQKKKRRLTFGVRGVRERWLVGNVLPSAEQVVLNDRPFVLELPPEAAMVVLEHTRTHLLKPGDSLGRQSENTRAFFSRGGTFEARSRPDCYAQRDK